MSRGYSVNGPSATGTANKTAVNVIGSTTVRISVFEFAIGITTAPNSTDQQLEYLLGRTTTAATGGSAPTPLPNDPSDVAAIATAVITPSGEPTYTAASFLYDQAINQRAGFRWVAVPGQEFRTPATASNGVGLKNVAVTASSIITGTVNWWE